MSHYRYLGTSLVFVGVLFFATSGWAQSKANDPLKYIPEETQLIFGLNFEAHRDTAMVKQTFGLLEEAPSGTQPVAENLEVTTDEERLTLESSVTDEELEATFKALGK